MRIRDGTGYPVVPQFNHGPSCVAGPHVLVIYSWIGSNRFIAEASDGLLHGGKEDEEPMYSWLPPSYTIAT